MQDDNYSFKLDRGEIKFLNNKRILFSIVILLFSLGSYGQSAQQEYFKIAATRFTLPANTSGLTDPGFTIWGKFKKVSLGETHYLYLTVKFEHSTASNPGPGFWYRYKDAKGNIYTDQEIGPEPFKSITFYGALFAARVNYGIHRVDINLEGQEIARRIGEIPKDFDVNSASVYVDELTRYNIDASAIRSAIASYEQGIKDRETAKVQKERQEAEAQKAAEEKAALSAKAREEQFTDQNTAARGGQDDFWSDNRSGTSRPVRDDNTRSASQFSGGLDDIREGGYFKDDKGDYFKKEGNVARIVSKSEYDRDLAQRTNEQAARQAQIRAENIQTINRGVDVGLDILTTTFYAQQLSRSMKDATSIGSDFENIDQLNAVFSQKMQEISYLSEELRSASARNMNTYITTQLVGANSVSEQAAISAIGVLGSVASSISSGRAERKAREELTAQRREAEAEIRERQREALVAIRHEIGNAFPEGGMPLSSHKINAPVLYLFAYSNDRTNWDKDQNVPLTVSNVIPVYRYSDGTYPYSSNVKRTFETGGVKNPVIVGYFTDARQAQQYRNSLINLAPNAKFALSNVEIKVKDKNLADIQNTSSNTDFWGNKKSDSTPQKNNTGKELDFWGMPINSTSKTATPEEEPQKKEESKKKDDFWNN